MRISNSTLLIFLLLFSCEIQTENQEQQKPETDTKITEYQYFDIAPPDTASQAALIAVTGEEKPKFESTVCSIRQRSKRYNYPLWKIRLFRNRHVGILCNCSGTNRR